MTGRERVQAALTFSNLDRVPRDLWALPYITLYREDEFNALVQEYPMDIGASQLSPGWSDDVVALTAKRGHYKDDWGSVWYVGEPGVIGEVKEPVLDDGTGGVIAQCEWGKDNSNKNIQTVFEAWLE